MSTVRHHGLECKLREDRGSTHESLRRKGRHIEATDGEKSSAGSGKVNITGNDRRSSPRVQTTATYALKDRTNLIFVWHDRTTGSTSKGLFYFDVTVSGSAFQVLHVVLSLFGSGQS